MDAQLEQSVVEAGCGSPEGPIFGLRRVTH